MYINIRMKITRMNPCTCGLPKYRQQAATEPSRAKNLRSSRIILRQARERIIPWRGSARVKDGPLASLVIPTKQNLVIPTKQNLVIPTKGRNLLLPLAERLQRSACGADALVRQRPSSIGPQPRR